MQWQFSNDAPIYAQLIRGVQIRIVAGIFPPGERLPSVRDLAAEAGVNPNTMQRARKESGIHNCGTQRQRKGRRRCKTVKKTAG